MRFRLEAVGQYIRFISGYAAYYEELAKDEKEKLQVLLSNDLTRLERSIAQQQVVEKKMERLEQLRESLQQAAGFEGMTGQQIIDLLEGEQKSELQKAYRRLSDAISTVQFYNRKSMEVCKHNLQLIGSEIIEPDAPPTYSPDLKPSDGYAGAKLFDKKI